MYTQIMKIRNLHIRKHIQHIHVTWKFHRKCSRPIRTQHRLDAGHRPLVLEFLFFWFRFEIYAYQKVNTVNFVQIEQKNISANQNAAWVI